MISSNSRPPIDEEVHGKSSTTALRRVPPEGASRLKGPVIKELEDLLRWDDEAPVPIKPEEDTQL